MKFAIRYEDEVSIKVGLGLMLISAWAFETKQERAVYAKIISLCDLSIELFLTRRKPNYWQLSAIKANMTPK